jgi:phosphatidylglycerol lysyltransferase
MRFGWNSTSYQILNPGIDHWVSPAGDAVVGYVRKGRWWLIAGAPVCDLNNLANAARQVERAAGDEGCRVCYVCANRRLRDLFGASTKHAVVTLGAEPVWDPHHWPEIIRTRSSLRAQLNRARNKGVEIERWDTASPDRLDELRPVLHEWLGRHGLPPLHFLVEPDVLSGEMADRVLLVARRGDKPVAFLVASPVPSRNGYLVEEIARGREAPNGAAELLIDAAMRELAAGGATYVTLGLVALSEYAGVDLQRNPLWIRTLMGWARAHGRRFYNFNGLEAFRVKMIPDQWEPIYAISNERRVSAPALHAMTRAFCDGLPEIVLMKAIWKAARQEVQWMRQRFDS